MATPSLLARMVKRYIWSINKMNKNMKRKRNVLLLLVCSVRVDRDSQLVVLKYWWYQLRRNSLHLHQYQLNCSSRNLPAEIVKTCDVFSFDFKWEVTFWPQSLYTIGNLAGKIFWHSWFGLEIHRWWKLRKDTISKFDVLVKISPSKKEIIRIHLGSLDKFIQI